MVVMGIPPNDVLCILVAGCEGEISLVGIRVSNEVLIGKDENWAMHFLVEFGFSKGEEPGVKKDDM